MSLTPDYWQQVISNPVDLHPELVACLQPITTTGMTAIKHPLVNEIAYMEQLNKLYNDRLVGKRAALETARSDKAWHTYVFLHEKPWRAEAFYEISDEIEDDREYWTLASSVWTNSENSFQWGELAATILLSERPQREAMMTAEDQERFNELPDVFTVYRGHQQFNADGWSWTIDHDKALWFSRRYYGKGFVSEGTINKANVIAAFLYSGEAEIVADPDDVNVIKTDRTKRAEEA